jgi:hypothetical protein
MCFLFILGRLIGNICHRFNIWANRNQDHSFSFNEIILPLLVRNVDSHYRRIDTHQPTYDRAVSFVSILSVSPQFGLMWADPCRCIRKPSFNRPVVLSPWRELVFLRLMFFFSIVGYVGSSLRTINRFCEVLQINCLTIRPKSPA